MEGQLNESSTIPSQIYAQSFFGSVPTDARFLQCTFHKVPPTSSIDSATIEFNLDRFDAANVWQIQETYVEVTIEITTANGSVPVATKQVAPINNILHSLFESVRITINDFLISTNSNNYPYKSYISTCLTYSAMAKNSHLNTQGYYQDLSSHMGPGETNSGWKDRRDLFREGQESTNVFRAGGTTFFGRLSHDLVSCTTGLPPNTKVKIELDRTKDAFFFMVPTDDAEQYKVKIKNIALFIPVAQLSSSVFNEMSTILARKTPTCIHYRKIEIRPVSIQKNKEEYYSDSLFPDASLPCRIVVCFIETSAKIGSYHT